MTLETIIKELTQCEISKSENPHNVSQSVLDLELGNEFSFNGHATVLFWFNHVEQLYSQAKEILSRLYQQPYEQFQTEASNVDALLSEAKWYFTSPMKEAVLARVQLNFSPEEVSTLPPASELKKS